MKNEKKAASAAFSFDSDKSGAFLHILTLFLLIAQKRCGVSY
ncbi:hypothetical protein BN136_3750 [Cronobacter universalis NCTC 9529]|nr:hypothetical protein BN136_3750 [Cronobacter universalis NCTC 9529]